MAGAEVEDLAVAAGVTAAAAEDFAALEPGDENEFVGRGDVEEFAVHLLVLDFEMFAQAIGNGMAGRNDPHPLFLAHLAPFQVAARPHQPLEELGEMAGVKDDEAHAIEDALLDALDNGILHLVVGHVAPPEEDIRLGEGSVAQTVLRFVEGGGADGETGRAQSLGQGDVDAVRVNGLHGGVGFFVAEFVPDEEVWHGVGEWRLVIGNWLLVIGNWLLGGVIANLQ